jgi:hypothetical protein
MVLLEVESMQYKDDHGKVYEISYSQKLQREQNRILRQKNRLLMALLMFIIFFAFGAVYLYFRLEAIDFLTHANNAVTALAGL